MANRINVSLSDKQLELLDEFAKENGVSRSAAISLAVERANAALDAREVRRLAAAHFLKLDQHRLGVQEIVLTEEGEIAKADDPVVEANRIRHEAHVLLQRAKGRGVVKEEKSVPDVGERVVEKVDPFDY